MNFRILLFFFLFLFILVSEINCQKIDQFVFCNVDTRFYTFDRNVAVRRPEKELKNYSADYSARIRRSFEAILSEENFNFVKIIPQIDLSDQKKMDTISGYLYDAWVNYIQSHNYNIKRAKKIKPTPEHILNLLNYFGDKFNTDHLGLFTINGFVREKPDRAGQFDDNAKGYITFNCYDIDVKTGRVLFAFIEAHPRASYVGGGPGNEQQKLDVLTDRIIETMSTKYLYAFEKMWSKKKVPKWKSSVKD